LNYCTFVKQNEKNNIFCATDLKIARQRRQLTGRQTRKKPDRYCLKGVINLLSMYLIYRISHGWLILSTRPARLLMGLQ